MKIKNIDSDMRRGIFGRLAVLLIFTAGLMLSACSATPTPDPQISIQSAVEATLSSMPTPTEASTVTPAPTVTPASIGNLFCEYNFCIGHPLDFYLMDQGSTRQPPVASTYATGIVFGYSSNLFIEMTWTSSANAYDPQTTLTSILQGNEKLQGSPDKLTSGDLTVTFQPISTVSSLLPFGEAAAWQCGDRSFAWKVYTPEDGTAADILKQSVFRFKCQAFQ